MDIAGGAATVRQALDAGVIDEFTFDIAAVLFGSGERMFDCVASFDFGPVEVQHSLRAPPQIRYHQTTPGSAAIRPRIA